MLSCETHFYMCNIELCENSRVSRDIADTWEQVVIKLQMQRMIFENTLETFLSVSHPALWDK